MVSKRRVVATTFVSASFLAVVVFSSLAHAWSDEKCNTVVLTGNEYKFHAKTIPEMIKNIEAMKIDELPNHRIRTPWEMGMIPNLAARKLGYQDQLTLIADWLKPNQNLPIHESLLSVLDVLNGVESAVAGLPEENPKLKELANAKTSDREELKKINPTEILAVCEYYEPFGAFHCFEELMKVMKVMAPVDNITVRDQVYEIMSNSKYQEPLSKLALEYIHIIENGLPMVNRRLDEDLLSALGSEDMKWSVLSVLAARGANFYKLFDYSSRKNFQTVAAMGIIASASLYFDSLGTELFSFPRGIDVSCDSGKSYHFWMPAYLSRRFGSKWAAYLSDVGYQMKSETEFRDPNRAFDESWDSPSNEKIRLDLSYSSAGARYGEFVAKESSGEWEDGNFYFDTDLIVALLDASSEKLTPVTKAQAIELWKRDFGLFGFHRWNQIFHPEKAMQY